MPELCPSCSEPATGRFCPHCGTALHSTDCATCGATLPADASFCNQCGTPAGDAAKAAPAREVATKEPRGQGNLPWIIAGVALVGLIAVLLIPRLQQDEPVAAVPPTMGDPTAVDLSSMTPREAADRLFNRVMRSVTAGDTVQARSFLPMAIAAYDRVPNIDLDGRYHLAVLHLVGGDAPAARSEADAILAADPNHLFGLFSAAQAELALGNTVAANGFFNDFVESYDAEMARALPEYEDHATALPVMRQEAEARLAGA